MVSLQVIDILVKPCYNIIKGKKPYEAYHKKERALR